MRLAQALLIIIGVGLTAASRIPGVDTLAIGLAITSLGFGLPILAESGG
jgi:glycerol uptake facilitator-like aquaporin